MVNPYTDKDNVRHFSIEEPEEYFVWHRDTEDRKITVIDGNEWKFQYDNDLPIDLSNKKLFISKGTYHRLIKGTGDLTLKIYKL